MTPSGPPVGALYVGDLGSGTLTVEGKAELATSNGYIGCNSGAGSVIVSGTSAKWNNSQSIYVAGNASGSLSVNDGALITTKNIYASPNDLFGNGAIVAKGAVVDANLLFDSNNGPQKSLPFGSGGRLDVNFDGSGVLGVGYKGIGNLRIAQGAAVASSESYIGYAMGSTGYATVTGTGSSWTYGNKLFVGHNGSGVLSIEDGGQIAAPFSYTHTSEAYIGYNGTGSVAVTGVGSAWWGDNISVGNATVAVNSGGQITARSNLSANGLSRITVSGSGSSLNSWGDLSVGGQSFRVEAGGSAYGFMSYLNSAGTVTGPGSTWNSEIAFNISGSLNVEDGGQVTSDAAMVGYQYHGLATARVSGPGSRWAADSFYVGYWGSGTLSIESGGEVTSGLCRMGEMADAPGTAIVTGTGSRWLNSDTLSVGKLSNATLTVADGGLVRTNTLNASVDDLYGDGTILANGALFDGDVTLDRPGSQQTVPFGTGGQIVLSLDQEGNLGAGYRRRGTLTIGSGATVSSYWGYIGYLDGSAGTMIVTGTGSRWSNAKNISVGVSGSGKLAIANGGRISAENLSVSNKSVVGINVSNDGMLMIGSTSSLGRITNNGKVKLYAAPFLAAGTYAPISGYAGRAMTWAGSGSYQAFGGTWSSTSHTFAVPSVTEMLAGTSGTVGIGQRWLITDSLSGKRVGASFGTLPPAAATFSASLMGDSELDALAGTAGFEGDVLAAWDFDTNLSGSEVLLSFDIGHDVQDVAVWHLADGTWTPYVADFLTHDSNGILSFTATSFSGYAVASVPEPATMGLLALGGLAILRRRRMK